MRWLPILLLSVGCRQLLGIEGGEVQHDAATDTVITADVPIVDGHDEDSDSIADGVDNCPTVANTDQLTLGDSLGVACDPRSTSGDRIAALFLFAEPGRPAELMGGQQFEMDHAIVSSGEIGTLMSMTPTRASVVVSQAATLGVNGSFDLRLKNYRCTVGPCSGSGIHCLRAEGDNATSETDAVLAPMYRLDLEQIGGKLTCRITSGPSETVAMADALIPETDRVRLRTNGVTITVDSFVVYDAAP